MRAAHRAARTRASNSRGSIDGSNATGGNAFGGKVRNTTLAVVDQDHGPQALRVRQALEAVHVNSNNFTPVLYDNQTQAVEDVRNGKVQGAVIIPPEFSRRVYEKNRPQIGLVIDNTDAFVSSSFQERLSDLVQTLNQPDVQPRLVQQIALNTVELYPYIEYMKRSARRISGYANYQTGTCFRIESRRGAQGHRRWSRNHNNWIADVRCGYDFPSG